MLINHNLHLGFYLKTDVYFLFYFIYVMYHIVTLLWYLLAILVENSFTDFLSNLKKEETNSNLWGRFLFI